MAVIFANELPYNDPPPDYRDGLRNLLAFSARDWSEERDTAYIYAIVFGWDADPEDPEDQGAWESIAAQHGWSDQLVEHLKAMRAQFDASDPA